MNVRVLLAAVADGGGGSPSHLWRVLTLADYNTRLVLLAVTVLGALAGLVGCFGLLRRRALLGDAISHATLPGIALAWLAGSWMGLDGRSLPLLLTGAALSGIAGTGVILAIRRTTRLAEDAALAVVLGTFFGAGVALLGIVQQFPSGQAAGLESFVYGRTASLVLADALAIIGLAVLIAAAVMLLRKELQLVCFDEGFAGASGQPVLLLDTLLMAMVVLVTIVGLQAVGLILVIALLVIPPAAARFWTENLPRMMVLAAVIGAASGLAGAAASAIWADLPSGAVIVLAAATVFLFSLCFGTAGGAVPRWLRQRAVVNRIGRLHLLRTMYELGDVGGTGGGAATREEWLQRFQAAHALERVVAARPWSGREVARLVAAAVREGLLIRLPGSRLRLTEAGVMAAADVVRKHRLWEAWLIASTDVAPWRADQGADAIEHVPDQAIVARLEAELGERLPGYGIRPSPHDLSGAAAGEDSRSGELRP